MARSNISVPYSGNPLIKSDFQDKRNIRSYAGISLQNTQFFQFSPSITAKPV